MHCHLEIKGTNSRNFSESTETHIFCSNLRLGWHSSLIFNEDIYSWPKMHVSSESRIVFMDMLIMLIDNLYSTADIVQIYSTVLPEKIILLTSILEKLYP